MPGALRKLRRQLRESGNRRGFRRLSRMEARGASPERMRRVAQGRLSGERGGGVRRGAGGGGEGDPRREGMRDLRGRANIEPQGDWRPGAADVASRMRDMAAEYPGGAGSTAAAAIPAWKMQRMRARMAAQRGGSVAAEYPGGAGSTAAAIPAWKMQRMRARMAAQRGGSGEPNPPELGEPPEGKSPPMPPELGQPPAQGDGGDVAQAPPGMMPPGYETPPGLQIQPGTAPPGAMPPNPQPPVQPPGQMPPEMGGGSWQMPPEMGGGSYQGMIGAPMQTPPIPTFSSGYDPNAMRRRLMMMSGYGMGGG